MGRWRARVVMAKWKRKESESEKEESVWSEREKGYWNQQSQQDKRRSAAGYLYLGITNSHSPSHSHSAQLLHLTSLPNLWTFLY